MADQEIGGVNPFIASQQEQDASVENFEPGLLDRFWTNFEAGQSYNTVLGSVYDASTPSRQDERKRFDRSYETYPEWDGIAEGLAAVGGQIAGTAMSPENFIPIGLGEKILVAGKAGLTGIWARIFSGAVDSAAANAVADATIQGIEIQSDFRERFDPLQYGASVLLGAGIGGAASGAGKLVGDRFGRATSADQVAPDPVADAPADNPFRALQQTPDQEPIADPTRSAPEQPAAEQMAPERVEEPGPQASQVLSPTEPAPAAASETIGETLSERAGAARGLPPQKVSEPRQSTAARAADDVQAEAAPGREPVPQSEAPADAGSAVDISPPREATIAQEPAGDLADVATLDRSTADIAKVEQQAGDFLMAQPRTGLAGQRTRSAAGSPAPAAVERIGRVRETAEALANALEVTATRQGRISGGKRVLGTFDTRDSVVRVRSLDDFDTLTHEYGHHLDAKIPEVKSFIKKHSKTLAKFDYDPVAGRDYEGFAEFFRLWITNRPYAQKMLGPIANEFRDLMSTSAPEMAKAIDDATAAWDAFLSAPSSVAVRSTIVSSRRDGWVGSAAKELKKTGLGGTITDVLQRVYTFAFDDLNPINQAVRYLQALHLENKGRALDLKVSADPYKLARMSRGAYSAGHMDVMHGVAPYRGLNPESPSLRDAIIEATGKPNAMSGWDEEKVAEFGAYLWSRRAIGEWERYRKGDIPNPPDKLTEADHTTNVAELEAANPAFISAASKVHEFSRALWRKKLDAGLIDQVTHDEGLMIRDYVPGLRDFSSDTDLKVPPGRSKGRSAKGGFAKRFKGSKRDVINPLESLAADAYETAMAISRNDVVKALHRLSLNAGPGAGAIAEVVPAKELRASMIDPLEAVENAAKAAGLSKPDILVLRDALESAVGSEKAAVFRPAIINEKGEPIVFFRDGGKLTALRLADGQFGLDMYRVISAMSQHEKNFWLELVAIPARVLRAGITTSFEFIGANFVRDQAMAAVYYGKPLQRIATTLRGGYDEIRGREIARSYSRVYGISGGQETASLSKAMAERDLAGLKRKGWVGQRLRSWRGVIEAAEISETATRLGLFRTFQQEAKARGLDEYEALLEASYRARDYIDFDRRGSGMAGLARVIPFLNVSLQGLDKASRHMIAPLARKVLGVATSAEDQRAAALASKTWARLAALVTASVSLYALTSRNEDQDEVSETTRSTHWIVKAGDRWTAIPKPFEFAIAINLGEAMYDAMIRNDPAAVGRWADSMATTLTPPSLLEGNPAIKSYFEVKSNTNFFTEAPIVPEELRGMEPFLQYTARSSALSKQLGRIFNVSPAISDHLITSFGGSWGRNLLSLYDLAQPDAPAAGWDDVPFARRFIKDAAKGAQSTTMFWELAGQQQGKLEGKALSWSTLAENGDVAGAADFYAGLNPVEKAYVAASTQEANVRRLHPIVRGRGALQAINAMRREIAANDVRDPDGEPVGFSSIERGAADDILSDLSMAIARNALREAGVVGWAQRPEFDETGYYRELEALNPALLDRLGSGYVGKKVWSWDAVKSTWPELRDRLLEDGSGAMVDDLVADVESQGFALDGVKAKRREKAALAP